MSDFIPKVLIFGHSFVRRLHDDLVKGFDSHAKQNFNLAGSGVYVCLKGTGGRTVEKVRKYDISAIASIQPDIIILELGTNDLCHLSPEVVGSRIEELARFFRDELRVKVVVVCQVIDRKIPHSTARMQHLMPRLLFYGSICALCLKMKLAYFSGNTVTLVVM